MSMKKNSKTSKSQKNPKILIRSRVDPQVDQVDLCPRIWSREFYSDDVEEDRYDNRLWRLCFYITCLPLCYPCYISRSLRRRRRRTDTLLKDGVYSSAPKNKTQNHCIFDASGDTLSRTTFDQVSHVNRKNRDNFIDVNVILLHSESSRKLEQYLVGCQEGPENAEYLKKKQQRDLQIGYDEVEGRPQGELSLLKVIIYWFLPGMFFIAPKRNDDARKWKNIIRLQTWKRSFRRRNSQAPSFRDCRPKVFSVLEERQGSMTSSSTEFFGARSVLDDEDGDGDLKSYSTAFGSLRNSDRTYYSCDSSQGNKRTFSEKKTRLNMKPLGKYVVNCEGIGYKLRTSIFDEGTVINWTGSDLDQLGRWNMDVIILVVRDSEELDFVLESNKGLLHYISVYWRGFYPLLLLELDNSQCEDEDDHTAKLTKGSHRLTALFGDIHRLQLKESEIFDSVGWLNDVLGRLYLHSRIYQCSRFYGRRALNSPSECPGGCELSRVSRARRKHPFTRKKVKWKMKGLAKFSKMMNVEEGGRQDHPELLTSHFA